MTEIAELRAQLATTTAERNRLAATPTIDATLAAVGVRPAFRRAVRALFLSRGEIELDGADVLVGGVPVESAIRAWVATPEGQAYLGGGKDGSGAPATKRRRSEMNTAEKDAYVAKHGLAAYEALPK
jgi:hypothetical protein